MPVRYGQVLSEHVEAVQGMLSADAEDFGRRAREALERSQELEHAAAANLAAGDADVREIAAAQLTAAAALDLATAIDVLGLPEVEERFQIERGEGTAFDEAFGRVATILQATPALGMRGLRHAEMEPALAGGAPASLDELRSAALNAITTIDHDASAVVTACVQGLLALGPHALVGVGLTGPDKLLGAVYDSARRHLRVALKFVAKAVSKVLRVLGPFEVTARGWLGEQLGGFTMRALSEFVVTRALGIDALRANVVGSIDAAQRAPGGLDQGRLDMGFNELESLPRRFGNQATVIDVVASLLRRLGPVIVTLTGWAAAALAGTYVLMLSYGIWMAGDYLDWLRTQMGGVLDLVDGVRSVVQQAVILDDAGTAPAAA